MAHWEMIDNLAARRFDSTHFAEEAALFVLEQLAADNWKRVRKFSGRSSFKTYLASVCYRLLEDFSRQKFGRKQPPAWIKRLGGVWVRLFQLLCLERVELVEAVERAAQIFSKEEKKSIEDKGLMVLEDVIDCRSHQAREVEYDDAQDGQYRGKYSAQERQLEDDEKELLLRALFQDVLETDANQKIYESAKEIITVGVELQAEERLLLKLCFRDGLSVTKAGRMLGYNRNQVHGRMRRLLNRLRQEFVNNGIDKELILLLGER